MTAWHHGFQRSNQLLLLMLPLVQICMLFLSQPKIQIAKEKDQVQTDCKGKRSSSSIKSIYNHSLLNSIYNYSLLWSSQNYGFLKFASIKTSVLTNPMVELIPGCQEDHTIVIFLNINLVTLKNK